MLLEEKRYCISGHQGIVLISCLLFYLFFISVLAAKQRLLVEKVYGKPHPFIKIIIFIGFYRTRIESGSIRASKTTPHGPSGLS